MQKILLAVLTLLIIVGFIGNSYAAKPAPYSEPALKKLNYSAENNGAFVPPVGATKEDNIKALIKYYSKLYSDAGYSFEKSIVRYSEDLNKDYDFMSKGMYSSTPAILIAFLSEQVNEIRKDKILKGYVDKSLSTDTVRALDNILSLNQQEAAAIKDENERKLLVENAEQNKITKENEAKKLTNIEAEKNSERIKFESQKKELEVKEKIRIAEAERRKERAKQQKELESIEKQNALKNLSGHYENQIKKSGFVDIKVISDDRATITIYNKNLYEACKIDNQEVSINFKDKGEISLIYGNESEVKKKDNNSCALTIKFKEVSQSVKDRMGYDYSIEIDQHGRCNPYCERGGTMMGRYFKMD
jgi:hypothetical protein